MGLGHYLRSRSSGGGSGGVCGSHGGGHRRSAGGRDKRCHGLAAWKGSRGGPATDNNHPVVVVVRVGGMGRQVLLQLHRCCGLRGQGGHDGAGLLLVAVRDGRQQCRCRCRCRCAADTVTRHQFCLDQSPSGEGSGSRGGCGRERAGGCLRASRLSGSCSGQAARCTRWCWRRRNRLVVSCCQGRRAQGSRLWSRCRWYCRCDRYRRRWGLSWRLCFLLYCALPRRRRCCRRCCRRRRRRRRRSRRSRCCCCCCCCCCHLRCCCCGWC